MPENNAALVHVLDGLASLFASLRTDVVVIVGLILAVDRLARPAILRAFKSFEPGVEKLEISIAIAYIALLVLSPLLRRVALNLAARVLHTALSERQPGVFLNQLPVGDPIRNEQIGVAISSYGCKNNKALVRRLATFRGPKPSKLLGDRHR